VLGDLTTNSCKDIVHEEFRHLFNFNFEVLVRGIRVVFNKVMFLVTDHWVGIFSFPISVNETVINDFMRNGIVKGRKIIRFDILARNRD
jgi:hypothetical protein